MYIKVHQHPARQEATTSTDVQDIMYIKRSYIHQMYIENDVDYTAQIHRIYIKYLGGFHNQQHEVMHIIHKYTSNNTGHTSDDIVYTSSIRDR